MNKGNGREDLLFEYRKSSLYDSLVYVKFADTILVIRSYDIENRRQIGVANIKKFQTLIVDLSRRFLPLVVKYPWFLP